MKNNLSPIFIMSKNRPKCKTANLLTRLQYPGEWFIAVQEDEEDLNEYIENWGSDKVLTYNYHAEEEDSLLDNYGDKFSYGASCARNGVHNLVKSLGYKRYWISDDDLLSFNHALYRMDTNKVIKTGKRVYEVLCKIAEVADNGDLEIVGLGHGNNPFPPERFKVNTDCYYIMNRKTDTDLIYKSRILDDYIFILIIYHTPFAYAMRFNMYSTTLDEFNYKEIKQKGGMEKIYKLWDGANRCAYGLLYHPNLKLRILENGTVQQTTTTIGLAPMLISEKYRKGV